LKRLFGFTAKKKNPKFVKYGPLQMDENVKEKSMRRRVLKLKTRLNKE
jgi:hypothetical protein